MKSYRRICIIEHEIKLQSHHTCVKTHG